MNRTVATKPCPTCREYFRQRGRHVWEYEHNNVIANLSAKKPKWFHRTATGKILHGMEVKKVGELLNNDDLPNLVAAKNKETAERTKRKGKNA